MKSIFDPAVSKELQSRITAVNQTNPAHWGKMNAFQMVKHCTMCDDMFLGKTIVKRVLIGRLIGKLILKKVLKDDSPFGRNSPTSPLLITLDKSGDMEQQKQEWLNRVKQYDSMSSSNFVHPFFGKMTREQIGFFAYKHADHHLRQFGA